MATSNVTWQVVSIGALRCHALDKLGRFILAWEALAPSLAKAPRTCQKWVRQMDMAMSDLRRLRLSPRHLPPPVPSVQLHGEERNALDRASLHVAAHEPTQHSVAAGCLSLPLSIVFGLAGREWYAGVDESGFVANNLTQCAKWDVSHFGQTYYTMCKARFVIM